MVLTDFPGVLLVFVLEVVAHTQVLRPLGQYQEQLPLRRLVFYLPLICFLIFNNSILKNSANLSKSEYFLAQISCPCRRCISDELRISFSDSILNFFSKDSTRPSNTSDFNIFQSFDTAILFIASIVLVSSP